MDDNNYFTGTIKLDGQDYIWTTAFPKDTTFECRRCSICCHRKIELGDKDIRRLERYGPREFFLDGDFMSTNEDKSCIHLHPDSSCRIYEIRPAFCRFYPFKIAPDFDNRFVLDIEYQCPFVDHPTSQGLHDDHIENLVQDQLHSHPEVMQSLVFTRSQFADYLRSHGENALLRRNKRLIIMDNLIDILCQAPLSIDHAKTWAKEITNTSDTQAIADALQEQKSTKFSRNRARRVLKNHCNALLYLDKGLSTARLSLSNRSNKLRIDDKYVALDKLENLPYSNEALRRIARYLKTNVRRPAFQHCYAQFIEYALSKKRSINDPAAESLILANALFPIIDTLSRVAAAYKKHDNITGADVRVAISNMDSNFGAALSDNSLFFELVRYL